MVPVSLQIYEQYIENYAPVFRTTLLHLTRLVLRHWRAFSARLIAAWLSSFPKLRSLALNDVIESSSLTFKTLRPLSTATQLRSLSLCRNNLTDARVSAILRDADVPPLEFLHLDENPRLSEDILVHLAARYASWPAQRAHTAHFVCLLGCPFWSYCQLLVGLRTKPKCSGWFRRSLNAMVAWRWYQRGSWRARSKQGLGLIYSTR